MRDWEQEYQQGIDTNLAPIAIGANIWGRSAEDPLYARDEFDGVISDLTIFDSQYDRHQVKALAGVEDPPPLDDPTVIEGVLVGTLEGDTLDLNQPEYAGVNAAFGDYGNDTLIGNNTQPTGTALASLTSLSEDLDLRTSSTAATAMTC